MNHLKIITKRKRGLSDFRSNINSKGIVILDRVRESLQWIRGILSIWHLPGIRA